MPCYINAEYCIKNKEFHSPLLVVKRPVTQSYNYDKGPSTPFWDDEIDGRESFNLSSAIKALKRLGFSSGGFTDERAFPGINLEMARDYAYHILRSSKLSFEQKGLLPIMIQHQFSLSEPELAQLTTDSVDKVRDIFQELFGIGLFIRKNSHEAMFNLEFFDDIDGELHSLEEYLEEEFEPAVGQTRRKENEEDDLFEEAKALVIDMQVASVSMLQRRFRIGYTRAARLVDRLQEKGIVGPYEGSKPRTVLVRKQEAAHS